MTDLFDQNNQDTTDTNVAPVNNTPFDDKLKGIVNEQGQPKYKDVNAALDALKASQDHIKRLEDEAKAAQTLTSEAVANKARAEALEEIVARLSNNSGKPVPETPAQVPPSEEAIVNQLESIIARREAQGNAQKNVQAVTSALVAKFGDETKTKEAVAAKAKELGMTPQKLGSLSSENPLAVLALFGVNQTPTNGGSTVPSATPLAAPKNTIEITKPEKSLLSGPGATDLNRKAKMLEIKRKVYEENGIPYNA